jgi:secreted PhoX family phosphatase
VASIRLPGDSSPARDEERAAHERAELSRRDVIRRGATLVAGVSIGAQVMAATGADPAVARAMRRAASAGAGKPGYGPLVKQTGEMTLPKDFTVFGFGEKGSPMTDGLPTPGKHDGMTCAADGPGRVRLVRNHERAGVGRAIGDKHNAYDRAAKGGVTSSVFDTRSGRLVGSGLVLSGTNTNCNGGPTPWGSWLSCEENTSGPEKGFKRKHGYVFEVPFDANGPVDPVPIKAMGRFLHEACAVDPSTGIVYMTEDNGDPGDGFYRYIPDHPGQLHRGGKLQMLAVRGRSRYNTARHQKVGRKLRCEWVTIEDPDPKDAGERPQAVYREGRDKGAARFLGLEGCSFSNSSVYMVASSGGDKNRGQIWRYTPKGLKHGVLQLLYESTNKGHLDQPDSLTVSPRGGVVVCEDGDGEERAGGTNRIRVFTPEGRIEEFARNDTPYDVGARKGFGRSEWAGATYSPDGKWLFVSLQYPGKTFAIAGPWERGWL